MTWRASAALGVALCLGLAAGCGEGTPGGRPSDGFPMTVTNCNRQVTIPRRPARVLTEQDTSTVVAAAGGAKLIVARAGEGDAPLGRYSAELGGIPQIAPTTADPPSQESILGLRPDLVIAGHVTMSHVESLEAAGIPVFVPLWFCGQVDPHAGAVGFEDIYRTVDALGQIFGTQAVARSSVADLRRRVDAVRQRSAGAEHRSAADVYVGTSLLEVYGRISLNHAILEALGLRNVFADAGKRTLDIPAETLLARDPEVIVLSYGAQFGVTSDAQAVTTLRKMPGLDRLRAVRDQRMITLNYSYLDSGPIAVDGLERLAEQLGALPR